MSPRAVDLLGVVEINSDVESGGGVGRWMCVDHRRSQAMVRGDARPPLLWKGGGLRERAELVGQALLPVAGAGA